VKVTRPKSTLIRIAADEYLAVVTKKPPVAQEGTYVNGQCFIDGRKIEIEARQQPLAQLALAWHEVLHAIDHQYCTELSETQVERLSRAIAATLWDELEWWILMGLGQHPQMETAELAPEVVP
jgi:hypothetical protein